MTNFPPPKKILPKNWVIKLQKNTLTLGVQYQLNTVKLYEKLNCYRRCGSRQLLYLPRYRNVFNCHWSDWLKPNAAADYKAHLCN